MSQDFRYYLYTFVIAILAGIIKVLFGYISKTRLSRQASLKQESERFVDAFMPTIEELARRPNVDTYSIVSRYYSQHARAVERYKRFINPKSHQLLDKDWYEYISISGRRIAHLEQYADCGNATKRSINCTLALVRLEAVMKGRVGVGPRPMRDTNELRRNLAVLGSLAALWRPEIVL